MTGVHVPKLKSYRKTLVCPPDKSISIRAVMLCSYAVGISEIKNLSLCDDVMSAIECMRALGASIEIDGNTAYITGSPFKSAKLDCGNSATTARLLAGLLSGLNGVFELDGDNSLRSRPMSRVVEPLKNMGANINDNNGKLPIKIIGTALNGINYDMPISSAQVKSSILLAGLNANGVTSVTENIKTRNHTEIMLRNMNGKVKETGNTVSVSRSVLYANDVTVAGDISSAAYPICLALCVNGGHCTVKNVGVNSTRFAYLDVLKRCGANVELNNITDELEPTCDISVSYGKLSPIKVGADEAAQIIDEIPMLCALACFIGGVSVFEGLGELRVKESDRLSGIVTALSNLGADIKEDGDNIIVRGGKPLSFGAVDPNGDHRIAMAAAVAGAAGGGVYLTDGDCVAVSYPDFFSEVIHV